MRENEKAFKQVYQDQLESILFSVNQYSSDYLSALITKTEKEIDNKNPEELSSELLSTLGANGFYAIEILSLDSNSIVSLTSNRQNFQDNSIFNKILEQNRKTISRLVQYYKTGYRKIEPAGMISLDGVVYQSFIAIIGKQGNEHIFIGLINPNDFVSEVLRPKSQEFADQQMIIAFSRKNSKEIMFTTDSLNNKELVSIDMWLFPELTIGIANKGRTIQELVNERLTYNLVSVGILSVLLIIGFTLVISNIRREVKLAQNKSDFVSNVSHELRTPLSLISMFAETLLMGRVKVESKKNEYIEIIFKESHRLSNIVNRILNFSKIEANKREYHLETLELNVLTESVFNDYSFHLEQKGFKYELETSGNELLINGDREAIYEAIVILIDNAIKYCDSEKYVKMKVNHTETHSWIEVEDHGIGIPKDRLNQIFDKFYRISDKDIYKTQGAGLGLSILKHIMDAHNGQIKVESQVGKGSTFKLIFNNLTDGKDINS